MFNSELNFACEDCSDWPSVQWQDLKTANGNIALAIAKFLSEYTLTFHLQNSLFEQICRRFDAKLRMVHRSAQTSVKNTLVTIAQFLFDACNLS